MGGQSQVIEIPATGAKAGKVRCKAIAARKQQKEGQKKEEQRIKVAVK